MQRSPSEPPDDVPPGAAEPAPDSPASDARPARPGRSRTLRARLLRALVAVLGLLALLAVILWLARAPVARWLAPLLARRAGYELEIGAIEGSWLTSLRVADVRLEAREPDLPLRRLSVAEAEVRFDPRALLREGLAGLERVRIEGVELALDLTRGAPDPAGPPAAKPFTLPAPLPALDVTDVDVEIVLPTAERAPTAEPSPTAEGVPAVGRRVVRLVDARVAAPRGGELDLAVPRVELDAPELSPAPFALAARIAARPLLDAPAGTRIVVHSLAVDGVERLDGPARLDLGPEPDALAWTVSARVAGGRLDTSGTLGAGTLAARVVAEGLDLDALTAPLALVAPAARLGGKLELRADVRVPLAEPLAGAGRVEADVAGLELAALGRAGLVLRRASVEAELEGGVARIERLALFLGENRLLATRLAVPLRAGSVEETARATAGSFVLEAPDLGAVLAPLGLADPARPLPPHELRLAGDLEASRLEITEGRLTTLGGELVVERGVLELAAGLWGDWSASPVAARVRLAFADLGPLAELLSLPPLAGALAGTVEAGGTLAAPRLAVDLAGDGLVVDGRPLGRLRLSAEAETARVSVVSLELEGPAATLVASGVVSQASGAGRWSAAAELEAVRATLVATAPEMLVPEAVAGGTLRAEVELAGPLTTPTGTVSVTATELVVTAPRPLLVDAFELEARVDPTALVVSALRAEVSGYGEIVAAGRLAPPAPAAAHAVTLERLELARRAGRLALVAPATLALEGGVPTRLERLELAGPSGRAVLALARTAELWRADVELADLRPTPFVADLLPTDLTVGTVDLTARVAWPRAPGTTGAGGPGGAGGAGGAGIGAAGGGAASRGATVELAARIDDLRPTASAPLYDLSLDLRLADERLAVRALEVTRAEEPALRAFGELPLAPTGPTVLAEGPLELAVELDLRRLDVLAELLGSLVLPEGSALEGGLSGRAVLGGSWRAVTGELALAARDVRLGLGAGAPFGPATARLELALAPERLRLETLHAADEAGGFALDAAGTLGAPLDVGAWASGDLPLAAPLDLALKLVLPDLAPLAERVEALRRVGGALRLDVTLGGTLGDPEPTGTFVLGDGELRLASTLPGLRELDAAGTLTPERLELTLLTGEMGGSPLRVTGGASHTAAGPELDVRVEGEDLLVARSRGLKVRADAEVTIEGPLERLALAGVLHPTDSRWVKNIDLLAIGRGGARRPSGPRGLRLFSIREGPLATATFDVAITGGEPFEVDTLLVKSALRPDLHLGGTGRLPVLTGTVYVDASRIHLPGGTLFLSGGVVRFLEDDPFVPRLELRGETRLKGYDVTVEISGPYDDPEIALSSMPPLPSDELLLLVFTGRTPSRGAGSEAVAQDVALYLAKDFFRRWLASESTEDQATFLERFELRRGSDITRSGSETTEIFFRLDEDVVRADDQLFLTAEQDVYDRINLGLRLRLRFR